MRVRRLSEAHVEERGRLRSHFLLDAGDLGSRNLSITWVDVPPGAEQRAHSHEDSEQVYVIVRGGGRMPVAGDEEEVGAGDLVFIPPATDHGIVNDGDETLVYVSATSPPVSNEELYNEQLAPEVADYDEEGLAAMLLAAGAGRGTVARVPRSRTVEVSHQQLAVCAPPILAVALIGARYLKHRADPPPRSRPAPVRMERAGGGAGVVHVTGAVRRRASIGVPAWARLHLAVRRAGGPARNADVEGVNLAAKVADGQQVVVPRAVSGGAVRGSPRPGEAALARR